MVAGWEAALAGGMEVVAAMVEMVEAAEAAETIHLEVRVARAAAARPGVRAVAAELEVDSAVAD